VEGLLAQLPGLSPDSADRQWIIIGLAGLAAFVFAIGVGTLIAYASDPIRRRLGAVAPAAAKPGVADKFAEWVHPLSKYVLPTKGRERDNVERQLIRAGFRSPNALATLYGLKVCLALTMGMAVFVFSRFLPQLSSNVILFYSAMAGAVGLVAPSTVLRHLVEKRQKRLRNGFPDALDMLVICVESGLGLTAAIGRVAEELQFSHPELAAELALVNAETRAGVEREAALKNLTERTGLDDIRGLVSLLVQTLRFGTSVADTLRVYSEEFRDKRMQRAEEQAAKIGTKLIFPLVLCLFPSFFVVAIGPAVLRIVDVFSQLSTNVAQ
jgi:tight adherence protein C